MRASLTLLLVSILLSCGATQAPESPQRPVEPSDAVTETQPVAEAAEPKIPERRDDLRVAVTIDDLPLADYGRYDSKDERRQTVDALTKVLQARKLPFVGFFNMQFAARDPRLMDFWTGVDGLTVGNHTWSHPRLQKVGIEPYLADLQRGHTAVSRITKKGATIPFRHPYMYRGIRPSERDAILEKLADLGSPDLPVTIETADWYYARGYLKAFHGGDATLAQIYVDNWFWDIQELTVLAERQAEDLFGRQPPQVMLLHGNKLNADHLPRALDWLQERGYRFVGPDEVLADPAYAEVDETTSPRGESLWLRLRRTREQRAREPNEVAPTP